MKTLIIGCETLKNEITAAMEITGTSSEICWLDAGLHNVKEELLAAVQEIVDSRTDTDRILLAASFCGNSICGLKSRNAEIIIPRVDDCISLLFGSTAEKSKWLDSYFLTEGWLGGKRNLWVEYNRSLEKYGEKRTARIFKVMLSHYSRFALLDDGCYDISPALTAAKELADAFSKGCEIIPVTNHYLEQLFTGPWPKEKFLTLPRGSEIHSEDLFLE